jgi:broad specificity phosphatase PhoE
MKSILRRSPLIAVAVLLGCGTACPQEDGAKNVRPRHVLMIRHAEKTGAKDDIHLSKKGVERADALFRLFEKSKERPEPFPVPDFIFAASNSTDSQRPLETVTPLAMRLKLPVDKTFKSKLTPTPDKKEVSEGALGLRNEIYGKAKYAGKTILISWRHKALPELAKTLGAKDAPSKWESECFDRVWQLTFNERGEPTFHNRPQRLLPGDVAE